jgi:serine protease Do
MCVCAFSSSISVRGQSSTPHEIYVKYDEYYRELGKWLEPLKALPPQKTLQEVIADAALLTDDHIVDGYIGTIKANKKVLTDEEIFAKRRSGVFIVGKLTKSDSNLSKEVNFDLIGTAFAIDEDGTCVSNYHVLKSVIRPKTDEANKDSIYFVITPDKKVYLIDQVLAFSQNNDLAIFKLNLKQHKIIPIPIGKTADVGASVYCIAHPLGHFYSFTKGIVSRNVGLNPLNLGDQYDVNGRPPIRMEITADYAIGASGGPILDKYGNLVGIVVSTTPIAYSGKDSNGNDFGYIQMMVKETAPLKALTDLLRK